MIQDDTLVSAARVTPIPVQRAVLPTTPHVLVLVCRCDRPMAMYRVELVLAELPDKFALRLSPSLGAPFPKLAGPEQRPDEYRWRLVCTSQRCRSSRVLKGETLERLAWEALDGGRFREVAGERKATGKQRRDARVVVAEGLMTHREAYGPRGKFYRCDLVAGVDF